MTFHRREPRPAPVVGLVVAFVAFACALVILVFSG
jgi:hypothetical protein